MLISYDEIKNHIGGASRADVAARLKKMGVRYLLRPDGKPITTIDAFNAALRLRRPTTTLTDTAANTGDNAQAVEVN